MDQYRNPHESTHTIDEVLRWFDSTGIKFINSIPKATPFSVFSENEKLFIANPRGSWFDHFIVQIELLLKGGKEGGFFIMIGQKQ